MKCTKCGFNINKSLTECQTVWGAVEMQSNKIFSEFGRLTKIKFSSRASVTCLRSVWLLTSLNRWQMAIDKSNPVVCKVWIDQCSSSLAQTKSQQQPTSLTNEARVSEWMDRQQHNPMYVYHERTMDYDGSADFRLNVPDVHCTHNRLTPDNTPDARPSRALTYWFL